MSPATNKPDHSGHGETRHTPYNIWTKDTKVKTAKCRPCGFKVDLWAWQCNRCTRRVCSKCCQDDPTGVDYNKQTAKDMIEKGCWCRRFIADFNPAFKALKKVPEKQEEQMAKDAAAKRKAMATSARKRVGGDTTADPGEGPSRNRAQRQQSSEEASVEPSESDVSDYMGPSHPPTLRPRTERQHYGDAAREDEDSGSEFSDPFRSGKASSNGKQGAAVEGDEDEYRKDSDVLPSAERQKGKQTKAASSSRATGPPDFSLPPSFLDPFKPREQREKERRKRKADAAELAQGGRQTGSSGKTKTADKVKSSSPLQDGHTLIVGAGIIGLFTAYELASRCAKDGVTHDITIVEIRDDVCELASAQCAGFLSRRGMPRDNEWTSLLSTAQSVWHELKQRGYGPNFGIVDNVIESDGSIRHDMHFGWPIGDVDDEGIPMPTWFKPKGIYYIDEDEEGLGRLDSAKLVDWLKRKCSRLGVNLVFRRRLDDVQENADEGGYIVHIGNPDASSDVLETLQCSQIVFAAGPFTTSIVRDLFFDGQKTGLSNTHSEYFWMEVPLRYKEKEAAASNPKHKADIRRAAKDADRGLTVATSNDGVMVDNWSTGTMVMVYRFEFDVVEICAGAKDTVKSNIDSEKAYIEAEIDVAPLHQLARQYLGVKLTNGELNDLNSGGATISVAKGGNPCLKLLRAPGQQAGQLVEMPGIWLSYGYGLFGTTLAPGAARTLVNSMMAGT